MNKKTITRIIYYELIPIIIGFYFFDSLGRVTGMTDFLRKMVIFIMYIIPLSIIYVWTGEFIFSKLFPMNTYAHRLMTKMINCRIRKEKGNEFCGKCPDSLMCITSVDKVDKVGDIDNMNSKIKGDTVK